MKQYKFKYQNKIYHVVEMEKTYVGNGYRYTQGKDVVIAIKSTLPAREKQLLLHRLIKLRGIKELQIKTY